MPRPPRLTEAEKKERKKQTQRKWREKQPHATGDPFRPLILAPAGSY